jgi:hypothetical protein
MRCFVLALSLVVAHVLNSYGQEDASAAPEFPKAVFGFKAGVNVSRFSASVNSETRAKAGLAFGMYIRKQTSKRFFLRPELYYSNQGQKDNYVMPYGVGPSIGRTTTSMHYINAPLIFEAGAKTTFQFGVQLGLLIAGKEKGTIRSAEVENNLKDVMTSTDFALVVGIGHSVGQHFNGGVRVNYGITDIYVPDDLPDELDVNVQNRVLHFYVAYSF